MHTAGGVDREVECVIEGDTEGGTNDGTDMLIEDDACRDTAFAFCVTSTTPCIDVCVVGDTSAIVGESLRLEMDDGMEGGTFSAILGATLGEICNFIIFARIPPREAGTLLSCAGGQ